MHTAFTHHPQVERRHAESRELEMRDREARAAAYDAVIFRRTKMEEALQVFEYNAV